MKQACQRDEGPDPGVLDPQSPHTRQFLHFQPSLGMLEINGLSGNFQNLSTRFWRNHFEAEEKIQLTGHRRGGNSCRKCRRRAFWFGR